MVQMKKIHRGRRFYSKSGYQDRIVNGCSAEKLDNRNKLSFSISTFHLSLVAVVDVNKSRK